MNLSAATAATVVAVTVTQVAAVVASTFTHVMAAPDAI